MEKSYKFLKKLNKNNNRVWFKRTSWLLETKIQLGKNELWGLPIRTMMAWMGAKLFQHSRAFNS